MRRRSSAGGERAKSQRHKAVTPKRRSAPTIHHHISIAARQETETERVVRERDEALEQQMAMAQVLGIISSSPSDLRPVFDTILANATRLCEGNFAMLCRYDQGVLVGEATCNGTPEFTARFMGRT